jgi:hypothetical protein
VPLWRTGPSACCGSYTVRAPADRPPCRRARRPRPAGRPSPSRRTARGHGARRDGGGGVGPRDAGQICSATRSVTGSAPIEERETKAGRIAGRAPANRRTTAAARARGPEQRRVDDEQHQGEPRVHGTGEDAERREGVPALAGDGVADQADGADRGHTTGAVSLDSSQSSSARDPGRLGASALIRSARRGRGPSAGGHPGGADSRQSVQTGERFSRNADIPSRAPSSWLAAAMTSIAVA